jgi:molybdopterin converting factor small subunit
MKVQLLFFGATAEAVGKRAMEIDLADEIKASDAFAEIVERFPALKNYSLLFAVNREYANGEQIIVKDDELAVFTAVSGG